MSKGRTIKKLSQKRAPRQCSLCGRTGHNARTCAKIIANKKVSPKKIKKVKKSSYIPVKIGDNIHLSAHVVELEKKNIQSHWDKLDVYAGVGRVNSKRVAVDFASMVRHANKKQGQNTKVIFPRKNKDIDILQEIARIKTNTGVVSKKQVIKDSRFNFLHKISHIKQNIQNSIQHFLHNFSIRRFALSVTVFLLIIAVPFPAVGYYKKIQIDTDRIVAESTNAFLSLQSSTVAVFQNNIVQAEYDLNVALNSFSTAEEIIDKEYKALLYVTGMLPVIGSEVKSRQELLLAGHHLALGNTYLVKGVDEATTKEDITTIDRLGILRQHIRSAIPQYKEALVFLGHVKPEVLPAEYQASFIDFKKLFDGFIYDMQQMDEVIEGIQIVLGGDGFKRYLVLFQNHHELRATGGFVGGFAVVDVLSGNILDIRVPGGGSYDLQGQLDVFVKPPLPLQLLNKRWEFQDGNWFPDFKASAEKMAWFYQHSRNTTVDGVIAINSTVLERLLSVVGPIENEEYELMLTAEDALKELQYEIETYDEEENKPKAVLSVLLEQLMQSLSSVEPSQLVSLVTELHGALEEREIQMYFEDESVQKVFQEYGWTGEILKSSAYQDYLMVVNTNLGGGKSDAKMKQRIHHQAVVDECGDVIDTVIITRYHEGDGSEQFFDEVNSSYIRVYVPEGAELLDAGGFIYPDEASFAVPPIWYKDDIDLQTFEDEQSIHVGTGTRITNEFGKTAFGNWIVTKPNKETQIYFTYKLPFNVFQDKHVRIEQQDSFELANFIDQFKGKEYLSRYSLALQKQSGTDVYVSHAVIYPDNWRPVWKTGDLLELSINGASLEQKFSTDNVFGVVMKQINK